MSRAFSWTFAAAGLFLAAPASAQSFTFNVDQQTADSLGLDTAEIESGIQERVEQTLNLPDHAAFVREMANASVISTKGMGLDYGSNFDRFIVGGSFGSGVSGNGLSLGSGDGKLPESGFSLQVAGMVGLNLGMFSDDESPLRRFKIYANYMQLPINEDPFTGQLSNVGGHLQIDVIKSRDLTGLTWGGLSFNTGYTRANYKLELDKALPIDLDLSGQTVTWNASGSYSLSAGTTTIPLEVSTNIQMLKVLSIFGGAGMNINGGNAGSRGTIGGELIASGGDNADDQNIGNMGLDLEVVENPTEISDHAFLGAQLNVLKFRVYGQATGSLSGEAFGGNVGLRFGI